MFGRLQNALVSRVTAKKGKVIRRLTMRNRLLLATDGQGWIVDQVSNGLRHNLPAELRSAVVTGEWQEARNCLIHFINRSWAWSDGVLDVIHPSNRLIGLWWHGRLDSPERDMQASLERARKLHPGFIRMQVTCCSGKETMLALGVPEEKIVLLPEGIDLGRFHPPSSSAARERVRSRLGVPSNAMAVGCFQKDGEGWGDGMEPKLIKGPDVLVGTLERLNQHYPIYAVIPGPARGYLKRRLTEAGVPYHAPGFVPDDCLLQCYHALDLYISPSRDEGGPAGVLESMASRVPVISTRTGMPADMIESGVNGFLVDVEDVDGLVASAVELIKSPDLRRRVAEHALQTIRSYDWPLLAQRYADELYYPILAP